MIAHRTAFVSTKLTITDYEELLDRGFTRCGTYIYKKDNQNSCCEVYAYKVDIDQFKMNKNQKKDLKRFFRYIWTDSLNVEA